jgi:hypothetical protein
MNAKETLSHLMTTETGLTGCGLAKRLRAAGFTADDVATALLDVGFTVQTERPPWGTVLHISRKPLIGGLAVVAALMGGDTGEAAWHNVLESA